jgi:hypothetical protein
MWSQWQCGKRASQVSGWDRLIGAHYFVALKRTGLAGEKFGRIKVAFKTTFCAHAKVGPTPEILRL